MHVQVQLCSHNHILLLWFLQISVGYEILVQCFSFLFYAAKQTNSS